jgi:hypothetical protein
LVYYQRLLVRSAFLDGDVTGVLDNFHDDAAIPRAAVDGGVAGDRV